MKIEVQSKKGLRIVLSVVVDKKTFNKNGRKIVTASIRSFFKRFSSGKVPSSVIKVNLENQFMEKLLIKF